MTAWPELTCVSVVASLVRFYQQNRVLLGEEWHSNDAIALSVRRPLPLCARTPPTSPVSPRLMSIVIRIAAHEFHAAAASRTHAHFPPLLLLLLLLLLPH